jgi:hypothetical protein
MRNEEESIPDTPVMMQANYTYRQNCTTEQETKFANCLLQCPNMN